MQLHYPCAMCSWNLMCVLFNACWLQSIITTQSSSVNQNPLGPIAPNVVIILSASSCDFRQCPWEIGSVTAERAGQGEVGGCTRRVQTAWPCLGSTVERSWSAQGGPFPSFLA